jgi:hypothetical protein
VLWLLLIVLLGVLFVGGFMLFKQQEEKKRQADNRAAAMLVELQKHAAEVARAPAATATTVRLRESLLPKAHNIAYLLLKSGLPDHLVFVNQRLEDLLVPTDSGTPVAREQLARVLAQTRVDFAVCSRALQLVAAVSLDAPEVDAKRIFDHLQAAGVRYVRLASGSLPKRDELRAHIIG